MAACRVAADDVVDGKGMAGWRGESPGAEQVAEAVSQGRIAGRHVGLDAEDHDSLFGDFFAGVQECAAVAGEAMLDKHQGRWCGIGQVPLHLVGLATDTLGLDNTCASC